MEWTRRTNYVHKFDHDHLDQNGVMHNHFMCEKCGLITDFLDAHTGQYHYCPSCGRKIVAWKER